MTKTDLMSQVALSVSVYASAHITFDYHLVPFTSPRLSLFSRVIQVLVLQSCSQVILIHVLQFFVSFCKSAVSKLVAFSMRFSSLRFTGFRFTSS